MRLKLFYNSSLNFDCVDKNFKTATKTFSIELSNFKPFTNNQFYFNTLFFSNSKLSKRVTLTKFYFFQFADLFLLFFFSNRFFMTSLSINSTLPYSFINFNLIKRLNFSSLKLQISSWPYFLGLHTGTKILFTR